MYLMATYLPSEPANRGRAHRATDTRSLARGSQATFKMLNDRPLTRTGYSVNNGRKLARRELTVSRRQRYTSAHSLMENSIILKSLGGGIYLLQKLLFWSRIACCVRISEEDSHEHGPREIHGSRH